MKSLVKRSWSANLQLPKEWRAAASSLQPSVAAVGAYLSLLSYARSQYETKSSHPQRRWVLGHRLRGSCCSLGWRSRRSWGSAEEWGLCHSGTRSSGSGCHPSPLSVLLLLYPYIAHSPLSKFLPKQKGGTWTWMLLRYLTMAWLWKEALWISQTCAGIRQSSGWGWWLEAISFVPHMLWAMGSTQSWCLPHSNFPQMRSAHLKILRYHTLAWKQPNSTYYYAIFSRLQK